MLGLTAVVLTGWAGFLIYVTNETKVTSSVVKQILRTIKADPQLTETLGLAIRTQPEWWLNGYPIIHGQINQLQGNIDVSFRIKGSLGAGTVDSFANIFLPHLHPDFTIFALVISSLTIFTFLLLLQFAQPRSEAISLFILWALWLAMGAWATDIIGNVQCDALTTETMPTINGTIRQRDYCRQMKIIQAFSWILFVIFTLAFYILLKLVNQAQRFGRRDVWHAPIQDLGWFHELSEYSRHQNETGQSMYPARYPIQPGYIQGQQLVYQIQPQPNGATVPTIV